MPCSLPFVGVGTTDVNLDIKRCIHSPWHQGKRTHLWGKFSVSLLLFQVVTVSAGWCQSLLSGVRGQITPLWTPSAADTMVLLCKPLPVETETQDLPAFSCLCWVQGQLLLGSYCCLTKGSSKKAEGGTIVARRLWGSKQFAATSAELCEGKGRRGEEITLRR